MPGPQEPRTLPAALRPSDRRRDQLAMEGCRDLLARRAGAITARIDMAHIRHPADGPRGMRLTPHRLAYGQRGLPRGRCPQEEGVARHRTRIILPNKGQPGTHRCAIGVEHQDSEQGMIGLPDGIGACGTMPGAAFVPVAKRRRPVLGL